MSSSEKFCLRWNDFESNISVAFRELREDKDFFDVTLACEDNQLSAHKVILSACSPFFRNILRRNPHQHPLLYLRGVRHSDLQSVLNFMYHGEVNVAQEELNSFLAVAEDLKVKGLTQNNSTPSAPKRARSPPPPPTRQIDKEQIKRARPTPAPAPVSSYSGGQEDDDEIQEVVESVKQEPREAPVVADNSIVQQQQQHQQHQLQPQEMVADDQALASYSGYEEDYGQYEEQGMEQYGQAGMGGLTADNNKACSLESPDDLYQYIVKSSSGFSCTLCSKNFGNRRDGRNHCEAIHFPNTFDYTCNLCSKSHNSKNSLNIHMTRYHKYERETK